MTYFNQAAAELESEFNARFDYVSEAYGQTARDANDIAREDEALYLDFDFRDDQESGFTGSREEWDALNAIAMVAGMLFPLWLR